MYICSISMLHLDEFVAKDTLTVNQYAKIVDIVENKNEDIKEWYKSVLTNSKIDAVTHFRSILQNDTLLSNYKNLLKFSLTYIEIDKNGEFSMYSDRSLYIENVGEFPLIEDDNSYDF